MQEKFDPKIEKQGEVFEVSKEDLLALRENKAFLNFVDKVKSLQEDVKKKGVDISKAMSYLETGEGAPDLVEQVLVELRQKDIEAFKKAADRSGRPVSEKEIEEIGSKTKHGIILEEFEFFMNLPRLKRRADFKKVAQPQDSLTERMTVKKMLQKGKEYSAEWEAKVLKAREEFQKNMWDHLRQYAEFWKKAEKEGLTPEIREEINDLCEFLTKEALYLSERYEIGRDELFIAEKYPEWYISQDYIKGGDFNPPEVI